MSCEHRLTVLFICVNILSYILPCEPYMLFYDRLIIRHLLGPIDAGQNSNPAIVFAFPYIFCRSLCGINNILPVFYGMILLR